ncbi:MAG TPA: CehA/McbA family metallohydrolase [Mycobacteriales bacterium]|nr:CehA/McbA family metallohydrolase [Mycobacteriales bacterium]
MRPNRSVLALVIAALAVPLAGSALGGGPSAPTADPLDHPVAQLYAGTAGTTPNPPMPPLGVFEGGYTAYVGSLHEHSGYSDGWAGSTPADYYAAGKRQGLDFMGGSDHSDFLGVPLSTSQYCFPNPDPDHVLDTDPAQLAEDVPKCPGGDPDDQTRSLRKWDATKEYARKATTKDYAAFQGFEWSSDVYGHLNVYFSKNYANGKTTEPTTKALYDWLQRRPEQAGGSDGVFTFNHPGAKDLTKPLRESSQGMVPDETFLNWSDFAYDARLDQQAVGIEVYNDDEDYGTARDAGKYPEGYYARALDKGWHVAPVGAEDLGHNRDDDWGGPSWAKTVVLATNRTPAALKAAMLDRRVYAVRDGSIRLGLTVDRHLMGSRLTRPTGAPLAVAAQATWPGHTGLTLELVTGKGKVVGTGTDAMTMTLHPQTGSSYVFLRAKSGSTVVGYSAPVWVEAARSAPAGEWLAGDLHVHTCYSHDVYCPRGEDGAKYFQDDTGTPLDEVPFNDLPVGGALDTLGMGDSNTTLTEVYTTGGTVQERFLEASLKGLDYLAITDHHSDGSPRESGARSVNDPGFGTSEVVGVPGYENSIHGHAQMLGATHVYGAGDQGVADANAMAAALRADGGLLQANHPADGIDHEMKTCEDTDGFGSWGYDYDVPVESVEVWNTNHWLNRPLPASAANDDAVFFWECMLSKGRHVAATGGGDSHWMSVAAAQGVGNPTTWVFAKERSARGVLDAVRQGRTSISVQTPLSGATQLLLEADADRDGSFESMIGDTVPPSTPMRVRALGTPGAGLVEVRANGQTLVAGAPLVPGGTVDFTSPAKPGWVRASLYLPDGEAERRLACDDELGAETTLCRYELGMIAMTSAIYLAVPPPPVQPCASRGRSEVCHPTHPVVPAAPRVAAEPTRVTGRRRRR